MTTRVGLINLCMVGMHNHTSDMIQLPELIAESTALYCIFQITEDYCYFSDSHCDFHPTPVHVLEKTVY